MVIRYDVHPEVCAGLVVDLDCPLCFATPTVGGEQRALFEEEEDNASESKEPHGDRMHT